MLRVKPTEYLYSMCLLAESLLGHWGGSDSQSCRTSFTEIDAGGPSCDPQKHVQQDAWDFIMQRLCMAPSAACGRCQVPAGALVVLHGSNVHFSRPNRSPASRHAYTMHVVDGEAAWAPHNWCACSALAWMSAYAGCDGSVGGAWMHGHCAASDQQGLACDQGPVPSCTCLRHS